ncbi:hypothetical protein [Coxiella-like endosymbiont]|uniref:hypothetical protein n=1 Tax=Coxiella-like endosymbiont TaxID=1592897 RepID=UPI00272A8D4F|nr:hypothetical protein [Coxiella-like endosymbiont]
MIDAYIGGLTLEAIHHGSLQPLIDARQQDGMKNRTVNATLQTVGQMLNLAGPVKVGWIKIV